MADNKKKTVSADDSNPLGTLVNLWPYMWPRDRLDLNVIHDRNPQFVVESDGSIRNGYAVKLLNMIPEPRVITRVIESASLLGRDELALAHLARFRAAFPREYRQWSDDNRLLLEGAQAQLRGANSAPQAAGSTAKK